MTRFLSYAQELEDLILYDVLKDVKNGFYIDVGANDPWIISVTKAFYEKGWYGINIDPLEEMWQLLSEDRKRDINLNVGAGDAEGELELSVNGGLSSVCNDIVEEASKKGIEIRKVPIKTLTQICDEYCPVGQEIAFCKIDVENFEREVLMGLDLKKYRPKVFAIEATLPCTDIPCYDNWESILLENGYELAYSYGINRYYTEVSNNLKNKFVGVDKLLEKYEVFCPVERNNNSVSAFKQIYSSSLSENISALSKCIRLWMNAKKKRNL